MLKFRDSSVRVTGFLFFFPRTFFRLQRCVRSPPRVTPLRCLTRAADMRSEALCRSFTAAAACWAPSQLQEPRAGQQPPETPTSTLPSPALRLRATWRERGVLAMQRDVAQDVPASTYLGSKYTQAVRASTGELRVAGELAATSRGSHQVSHMSHTSGQPVSTVGRPTDLEHVFKSVHANSVLSILFEKRKVVAYRRQIGGAHG